MERIQRILGHDKYLNYLAKIKTLEQGRPFCLHPIDHSIDVARIAYILWLEQKSLEGDFTMEHNIQQQAKLYLYTASLLHDIGRFRQYLDGENHAQASAELAVEILNDVGFNQHEQVEILDAIRYHNLYESTHLYTQLLQKADRLSRKCFQCKEQARCYKIDLMEAKDGLIY